MKRGNADSSFTVLMMVLIIGSFVFGCNHHSYTREYGREDYDEPEIEEYTEEDIERIKEEAYEEGYNDASEETTEDSSDDINLDNQVTWATVYYTPNGDCYHMNPSCLSLRDSKTIYEVSLEDLYNNGSDLKPCDICVPHSDDY